MVLRLGTLIPSIYKLSLLGLIAQGGFCRNCSGFLDRDDCRTARCQIKVSMGRLFGVGFNRLRSRPLRGLPSSAKQIGGLDRRARLAAGERRVRPIGSYLGFLGAAVVSSAFWHSAQRPVKWME